MKSKERSMGIIMSILMSVAMGVVASYLVLKTNPQAARGSSVPMMYISNIILSVIVGVGVALFVPLGKIGMSLARKANANPPGFKFNLINSIPLSVGNTLIVSTILSLIGVISSRAKVPPEVLAQMPPFPTMWLGGWAKLLLPTLIISYVIAVMLSPIVAKIVGISGPGVRPVP